MKHIITGFLFLLIATFPAAAQQYGTPFKGVPDRRDVTIYQVNIRAFSPTRDLKGVIARLDQIKALGVNVIYLMPVYPVGILKSTNSPYCIRNFDSVAPEFGTLADLRALVDGAHRRHLAVILDWVVNQTSWDHPWITRHPDWYVHDANGAITWPSTYRDVAALNFASPAMRLAMIHAMTAWVYRANVDGFRCDFADNPPIDFWRQAIDTLRAIHTHRLLLMAEGSRSANYSAGFDYNFGFRFYGTLKRVFANSSTNNPTTVTRIDAADSIEYLGATGNQQIVRYITNHDVDGSDGSPVTLLGGIPGSTAAFVIVAYRKGVPFVYDGTEVAFPTAITFPFMSQTIDWNRNPDVLAEYKLLISLRNRSTAIRRGKLASFDNNDICAFTKTAPGDTVFVAVNCRNNTVNFPVSPALKGTTWSDAFTRSPHTLGSSLNLPPYGFVVLRRQ